MPSFAEGIASLRAHRGGLLESTHSEPQDRPTSNDEGSRTTTPIKNINLLNDRLEAREQGNRSRFKKYEVLIELLRFENRAVIWTMSPPVFTVNGPVNMPRSEITAY